MRALFLHILRGLLPGIVFVAASAVLAQPAAPPAKHAPPLHPEGKAIQEAPGEGDAEEAEAVDEAADAKPHSGPYASPYKLSFRAPLRELLFDAAQPRGSVAVRARGGGRGPVHRL